MIYLDRSKKVLTEAQEDCLKQIYLLTEQVALAGTQALADRLEIAPSSVTVMIQKLGDRGLVTYEQYRGVGLTASGRDVALEILRHHRLLESFLFQALGYGWDEVHDEAERLEHYISETLEARMDAWLGHPSRDPHGDPIPDPALQLPADSASFRLTDQSAGFRGRVLRVGTQDRDELNLFKQLGLVPQASLQILAKTPDNLRLQVGAQAYLIPINLAEKLSVEKELS